MTGASMTRIIHFPVAVSCPSPGWTTRLVMRIDRWLCGLRGHDMVLHLEPHRLSLHCLWCGAETCGWTLDVRPPRRRPASVGKVPGRSPAEARRRAA